MGGSGNLARNSTPLYHPLHGPAWCIKHTIDATVMQKRGNLIKWSLESRRCCDAAAPGGNCLAEASKYASCRLAFSWAHALPASWQAASSA